MNTYNNNSCNGRVNIEGPNIAVKFSMIDKIPINDCTSFRDALNGNVEESLLSNAFFSSKNIQILQNAIRNNIYTMSNKEHLIGPQDCDSLMSIMRGLYLQHAINLPYDYTEQIRELNMLVIDYSVKQIYGEIDGYMKYKRDASNMYTLMPRPILESTKTKQLELKKWF